MFLKEMCEYRIGHELFFLCEISICKLCSITYSSNVKNELPHGFSYFLVIWSPWIIFSLFWEVPDCDQGRPSLQADHHADCVGPHLAEGASSCGGTGRDREGASTEPKMRLCGAISVARHGFAAARLPPKLCVGPHVGQGRPWLRHYSQSTLICNITMYSSRLSNKRSRIYVCAVLKSLYCSFKYGYASLYKCFENTIMPMFLYLY